MNVIFYLSGAVAILSTLAMIFATHAIHGLLYLVLSFFSVAMVFYTLGAPFAAALEVIVYAGAIMVLFVFVVMLLNLGPNSQSKGGNDQGVSSKLGWGPIVLSSILVGEFLYILCFSTPHVVNIKTLSPKDVGLSLFGTYSLGVELASMLLLAGLVGAYHLGSRTEEKGQ